MTARWSASPDSSARSLEERAHAGEFGISVSRAYRERGIGTALLNALFDWASQHGIRRIEGIAFATNERALALYRRMGFEVEGRKVGALVRDGAEIDAFVIVKRIRGSAE